ncbi:MULTISPECIES: hypothetical protein [Streptomyces]|nr:hypothetical protein [Streptomyces sp. XY006]OXS37338.1 hypothetical protein CHR28_02310 [Streptomyces sp. XY006]
MRKIISCGLITMAALSAATPAFAADDSDFGSGVNAANNWNFSAAAVCLQEVAVVPVLGDHASDHVNNCSLGNVLDQAVEGVQALGRS